MIACSLVQSAELDVSFSLLLVSIEIPHTEDASCILVQYSLHILSVE